MYHGGKIVFQTISDRAFPADGAPEGAGCGGCAIEAEGVCRLVRPGVRTCAPFAEGILHSWTGGLGVRRGGGGEEGRFKTTVRGRQLVGLPNSPIIVTRAGEACHKS